MGLVIQTKLRGSNAGDGSKKMVLVLKGAMEEVVHLYSLICTNHTCIIL